MSPFVRFLVSTVRAARAAGLRRDPAEKAVEKTRDWESFGRDLGRAVRKLRDSDKQRD